MTGFVFANNVFNNAGAGGYINIVNNLAFFRNTALNNFNFPVRMAKYGIHSTTGYSGNDSNL
ncbi:hypothetical protein, partial [Enterobacter roggenkampii]|uniref:hypothetical protein n=1 Tax=Enterobacter roggenkampii TaxID=1812935 RepID=UPI003CE5C4C2